MRIGQGFDVHAFTENSRLILGGVDIPYEKGLAGHSDADVLIHAVCDALLGAAALGDIGQHYPDSSADFENIDSRILLKDVVSKLAEKNLTVSNLDCTIVAQQPKLSPYLESMCKNIASDVSVPVEDINVKATTTEHLGFTGRGEGIAAFAIVLLATTS